MPRRRSIPRIKIIVGGIAAALLPNQIYEETGIYPICGLLNEPGKLGLPGDECIDQITPDYSMPDDIDYVYPFNNAYFLSATKGCGNKCGFCAVQTPEPAFVPHINIRERIKAIDEEFERYLSMPEKLLAARGKISKTSRGKSAETEEQFAVRKADWERDQRKIKKWNALSKREGIGYVDFELIRVYRRFVELKALPKQAHETAKEHILAMSMPNLAGVLDAHLKKYKRLLFSANAEGKAIFEADTKTISKHLPRK